MPAFKPLLTTSAMVLAATSFAASKDDSTWINSGIVAAIQNGQKSYYLPAGTYVLQHPVVIPAGTKNFTLKGAGSGRTILTNPSQSLDEELMVGLLVVLHNNWNLTNRTNYTVSPVHQGDKALTVTKPKGVVANHYYVLWDSHTEWANNQKVTDVMNHAEIVKFTNVSANGTATLDNPAGREYDSSAEIADVDSFMCQNVTITGLGFDGSVAGSTTPSAGFMTVGLADGVSISDIAGKNFLYTAMLFVNSRNVLVDHSNLSLAAASGPGQGYGFCFSRCRFTSVTNSTTNSMRHGFIFHAGTLDGSFTNCVGTSGGFDAHGMDDRRLTFTNCSSDDTIQLGNQAWPEGDQYVSVDSCTFAGGFNACAYAKHINVSETNLGSLFLWSDLTGVTNPAPGQYVDDLNFSNCGFSAPDNLIYEAPQVGTVNFTGCKMESTRSSWGYVLKLQKMGGNLNFSNCTFVLDSTRGDVPLAISSSASNLNLNISNSTITSKGPAPSSTSFSSTFAGASNLKNNLFLTYKAKKPVFFSNSSNTQVVSVNNTVTNGQ